VTLRRNVSVVACSAAVGAAIGALWLAGVEQLGHHTVDGGRWGALFRGAILGLTLGFLSGCLAVAAFAVVRRRRRGSRRPRLVTVAALLPVLPPCLLFFVLAPETWWLDIWPPVVAVVGARRLVERGIVHQPTRSSVT